MSPTRRDVVRSLAGVAVALPAMAVSSALPTGAGAESQPENASAARWGARQWADYFELCMTSFPRCRDVTVEVKDDHMVKVVGSAVSLGLMIGDDGNTMLYVLSPQSIDESAMKIALNGLALAVAAGGG